MSNLQPYKHWKYTLGDGESVTIETTGQYITCLGSNDEFQISVDGTARQFMAQGLGFSVAKGEEFLSVRIFNTSGADNTIELAVGHGSFNDSRLSLTGKVNLSDATIAAIKTGQTLDGDTMLALITDLSLDDPTIAALEPRAVAGSLDHGAVIAVADAANSSIAAMADQREVMVQAEPDNTGFLRINSDGTADEGLWLAPGQSITIATDADVYVVNDSGASQDYSYLQVGD